MPIILVVDDSEVDRRLMKGLLEKDMEWLVEFASNGVEALETMALTRPDVVVTDLVMPDMDGMQLVSEARDQFSKVPVVLVTGQGSELLAMDALRRGAASYVPKAHLADNLLETVEQVLALRDASRSNERLIECTTNTRYKFQLDNDPALIAPLVDRVLQVMIGMRLCTPSQRMHVGVALEEALLNALCHGNLELPIEYLSRVRRDLHDGKKCRILEERRVEPEVKDRKILVGVDLTRDKAQFVIRDQGQGFDTASLPPAADPESMEADSGRGLVLIRAFMDEVDFNETGNEIRMALDRRAVEKPVSEPA